MEIIFLDGNKQNITIENLKAITRKEGAIMTVKKLFYEDASLTEIGTNIAKIYSKIGEKNNDK